MNDFIILLLLLTSSYLLLLFNQEWDWMKWNATVARRYSLGCEGIDVGKRVKLMENSQSSKHNRVLFAGLIASPGSTVGGETMSDIRQHATKANSLCNRSKKQIKQSSILCATEEDSHINPSLYHRQITSLGWRWMPWWPVESLLRDSTTLL